jgi:hypothetical protein
MRPSAGGGVGGGWAARARLTVDSADALELPPGPRGSCLGLLGLHRPWHWLRSGSHELHGVLPAVSLPGSMTTNASVWLHTQAGSCWKQPDAAWPQSPAPSLSPNRVTAPNPRLLPQSLAWGRWAIAAGALHYDSRCGGKSGGGDLRRGWPARRYDSGAGGGASVESRSQGIVTPGQRKREGKPRKAPPFAGHLLMGRVRFLPGELGCKAAAVGGGRIGLGFWKLSARTGEQLSCLHPGLSLSPRQTWLSLPVQKTHSFPVSACILCHHPIPPPCFSKFHKQRTCLKKKSQIRAVRSPYAVMSFSP